MALIFAPSEELTTCISQSLAKSYGEDVKQVIFYQLKAETKLNPEEIAIRPEVFSSYLDRFFGQAPSNFIKEKLIVELRNRFSIPADRCTSLERTIRAVTSD
jgi:hypothetical protein